ncbi:hypothetical protein [Oleiphilus sp. HI0086]|uniref:hypothetical protein n=1 Tax=Oleiphilus sp. HI0086 TaxID=1822260 RepID=UPI0007C40D43|nr:hypothetical protein [Oleiphilus sp. HI0086]KZZ33580.1 hypothetical protein A3756_18905 [Oleiphilus sp. HI0086]
MNFIFFHEHANHPELNPNLDQVFESIHQSLMSENSDIFQLENFSLIPNLADLDDLDALDDLDWIDLLLHSKAEIRILTEMGKRNIKDRDMDSYTSADLLNEGLCSLEHDTITTSQGFNLLALNSIFEQCKFFLVQQSGTLESALLSTKHLLLSQASNHLAKEQVIFFYEERGESGTHKLQQIIDQREKLNHLIRSSKGGKKVPWFYELFYERAKQFIREIWLDDLKNGLTILRSGHAIPILRNLHEMKYEAAKELIPDDSTIERYIKEVHKYMELPPHKKGRLKPLDRNYNHLKETFEHIIHKPIETLRLENYPSKEKFLPVKNHGC